MKDISYIVFITIVALHSYSLLNASMNTKDRIEEIRTAYVQAVKEHTKLCFNCQYGPCLICPSSCDISDKFYQQIAVQVLRADDLTHLEKLNYLYASAYFEPRKEIIRNMITQGAHPDTIVYHVDNTTPMKEAILFKDNEFKAFLIEHGAKALN